MRCVCVCVCVCALRHALRVGRRWAIDCDTAPAGLLLSPRPGLAFVIVELLQPRLVSFRNGQPLSPGLAFVTGAVADVISTAAVRT